MSMFAKIMVIVNFVLAVAFLAAAGTLLGAAEDYKGKYETYMKTAEADKAVLKAQGDAAVEAKNAALALKADAEKSAASASAQLKVVQDSANATAAGAAQVRADLDKLSDAQKDLQGKLTDQNKTIDELRGDLSKSEAARKAADDTNRASNDTIARLTQDKETAEKALAAAAEKQKQDADQIDGLNTTVARYKQQNGPLTGAVSMADVHGVVQAVNNQVDIYVISVGSHDGVKPGYEFTVYRGSEYVSTIVIDKVFPNYASGTTKAGTKKRDVMAGDEVATRL